MCFDERDFPYGCNLVEAIASAVYESRKVIAVVSPDYLASRWCVAYEFVLTYTRILNKEASMDSLLLIKYKNCEMPEHMKCLKYLNYTLVTDTSDNNRNVLTRILSFIRFYNRQPDVRKTFHEGEALFFDRLLSWLGDPVVGTEAYNDAREEF